MTMLLVDAGNARLKWASLDAAGADGVQVTEVHGVAVGTSVDAAVAAFSAALTRDVDTVVIGNVAGREFGVRLAAALEQWPHVAVWFARSRSASCGVRSAYSRPQTLGVDRWAAIVAGFRRSRAVAPEQPVCIVDAGTALTIDAVGPDGAHLGGLILPGLHLQRSALLAAAADIRTPAEDLPGAPRGLAVFAHSTAEALANSGKLACAAAVDRCVRTLGAELGPPTVLLCGGDAATLAPWLESGAQICPNLVFEGLAMLFEQRTCE